MQELKQRIIQEGIGKAEGNVVLVSSFINHQIDPQLTMRCAKEFERIFKDKGATRIVTIEASGIAPAVMLGYHMNLPVVFIKKNKPKNVDESFKSWVYSFTKADNTTVCIAKDFLTKDDKIIFIDDFLADGHASGCVIDFCRQSGAEIIGMGFLVEKAFAKGGQFLRDHHIEYHSLARITRINPDNSIVVE